jgi:phospholipid/cholesterol/gamma-HCH transport system permease protein
VDPQVKATPPPQEGLLFSAARRVVRGFGGLGHRILGGVETSRRIGAFTLITLGTLATKFGTSSRVIRPLVQQEILRSGVKVLPIVCFLGMALGLVIVGQTVLLLVQVGQTQLMGPLLVTVVVRELGPLTVAMVVLARVGTAAVTELGTARAVGEVEALEAMGIDPIHYLVVPRLIGFTVSIVSLTVYMVMTALLAGYLVAFLQGFPIGLGEYLRVIADAVSWVDFPLLALKTLAFGMLTSLIICYHGLAEAMRLEDVGHATTKTVAHTMVACLFVDALFLPVYFLI